ncbi:hypothetical protein HYALB_00007740 [Hymenoscyphus albidus]|uniref:Uncharacterized protein n=1 Tax=Hymenoscyphus albidus TaxID=595503 RepID=A0A9N9LCL4_9HELO|nr:hypothetical protein HYALB_00007740 [Hymenoscyphus albidus]
MVQPMTSIDLRVWEAPNGFRRFRHDGISLQLLDFFPLVLGSSRQTESHKGLVHMSYAVCVPTIADLEARQ